MKAGNAIGILGKLFGQDLDRHVAANLSQERHEFDPGDNTKCNPGSDDLMGLIENDPMVEKLPATTSKPALRNSILPRAGRACACTMKPRTLFSAEFAADVYWAGSRAPVRNPEISPDFQTNSRPRDIFLTTAIFVLGKTVPAIHWTVFSGLKRNFALLFAVRTDCFMHLSRTPVVFSILESHVLFLH